MENFFFTRDLLLKPEIPGNVKTATSVIPRESFRRYGIKYGIATIHVTIHLVYLSFIRA